MCTSILIFSCKNTSFLRVKRHFVIYESHDKEALVGIENAFRNLICIKWSSLPMVFRKSRAAAVVLYHAALNLRQPNRTGKSGLVHQANAPKNNTRRMVKNSLKIWVRGYKVGILTQSNSRGII